MIIDSLACFSIYCSIHPGFAAAELFLSGKDLLTIPNGEYPIDGNNVYAIVQTCAGRGKKESPLEAHRDYIDIQIVVNGDEVIGWRSLEQCKLEVVSYNKEKDIAFYDDDPVAWLPLAAGNFAIFYPEDAHAPLAGEGAVKKIIIKVKARIDTI